MGARPIPLLLVIAACHADPAARAPSAPPDGPPVERAAPASRSKLVPLPATAGRVSPHWRLESEPPNATIWVDGVDTGARTPAEFVVPPEGKYSIRFSLDGYADETAEIVQQAGSGLLFGRSLRPKDVVAREEASRIAAQRPVDERAREATRRFLGADWKHARVVMERSRSIDVPVLTLSIGGDGAATASWTWIDDKAKRTVPLKVSADELRRIFEAMVAQGFAEVVGAERPGQPCELTFRITVTNAAGESRSAEKWVNDTHPRFDPVLAEIVRVMAKLPAEVRKEIGY